MLSWGKGWVVLALVKQWPATCSLHPPGNSNHWVFVKKSKKWNTLQWTFLKKSEEPNHKRCLFGKWNSQHLGGRQVPLPLFQPCTQLSVDTWLMFCVTSPKWTSCLSWGIKPPVHVYFGNILFAKCLPTFFWVFETDKSVSEKYVITRL